MKQKHDDMSSGVRRIIFAVLATFAGITCSFGQSAVQLTNGPSTVTFAKRTFDEQVLSGQGIFYEIPIACSAIVGNCSGLELRDTIPPELNLIDADPLNLGGGSFIFPTIINSGGYQIIVYQIDSLIAGFTGAITLELAIDTGSVPNMSVIQNNLVGSDTGQVVVASSNPSLVSSEPDWEIRKNVASGPIYHDNLITYQVGICLPDGENPYIGTQNLLDVEVTDLLPPGAVFVSTTGPLSGMNGDSLFFDFGDILVQDVPLTPGGNCLFFDVVVQFPFSDLVNNATGLDMALIKENVVNLDGLTLDSLPYFSTDTSVNTLLPPDIRFSGIKNAEDMGILPVCDIRSFTVNIENESTRFIDSFIVIDTINPQFTLVSFGMNDCVDSTDTVTYDLIIFGAYKDSLDTGTDTVITFTGLDANAMAGTMINVADHLDTSQYYVSRVAVVYGLVPPDFNCQLDLRVTGAVRNGTFMGMDTTIDNAGFPVGLCQIYDNVAVISGMTTAADSAILMGDTTVVTRSGGMQEFVFLPCGVRLAPEKEVMPETSNGTTNPGLRYTAGQRIEYCVTFENDDDVADDYTSYSVWTDPIGSDLLPAGLAYDTVTGYSISSAPGGFMPGLVTDTVIFNGDGTTLVRWHLNQDLQIGDQVVICFFATIDSNAMPGDQFVNTFCLNSDTSLFCDASVFGKPDNFVGTVNTLDYLSEADSLQNPDLCCDDIVITLADSVTSPYVAKMIVNDMDVFLPTGDPGIPSVGTNVITYEIELRNNPAFSNQSLVDPLVIDWMDSQTEYIPGSWTVVDNNTGMSDAAIEALLTFTLDTVETMVDTSQLLRWQATGLTLDVDEYFTIQYQVSIREGEFGNIENLAFGYTDSEMINCLGYHLDSLDFNGNGLTDDSICISQATIAVIATTGSFEAVKWVKGYNDTAFVKVPDFGSTNPLDTFEYLIQMINSGNVTHDSLTIVDILPHVGDVGALLYQVARESEWEPDLVEITADPVNGVTPTIFYSNSYIPCRSDELITSPCFTMPVGSGYADGPCGCEDPMWSSTPIAGRLDSTHSFKVVFGDATIAPGDTVTVRLRMVAPIDVKGIIYNSFAYSSRLIDPIDPARNRFLLPAEPNKVCNMIAVDTIGDLVWMDLDTSGTQDDPFINGELGIPDVPMALLNADGQLLAITTTDANGRYYFTNEDSPTETWWDNPGFPITNPSRRQRLVSPDKTFYVIAAYGVNNGSRFVGTAPAGTTVTGLNAFELTFTNTFRDTLLIPDLFDRADSLGVGDSTAFAGFITFIDGTLGLPSATSTHLDLLNFLDTSAVAMGLMGDPTYDSLINFVMLIDAIDSDGTFDGNAPALDSLDGTIYVCLNSGDLSPDSTFDFGFFPLQPDVALIKELDTILYANPIGGTYPTVQPVRPDDTVRYKITVINQGMLAVDSIEIVDYFDETYYTFASNNVDSGWTHYPGNNWAEILIMDTLMVPDTMCVYIDLIVRGGSGARQANQYNIDLLNVAEISDFSDTLNTNLPDVDSYPDSVRTNDAGGMVFGPSNNVADSVPPYDEDDHDPALPPVFDLALIKQAATPPPYSYGDLVTFNITVENQGTIHATNIQIADYIPDGFDTVGISNPGWTFVNDTAFFLITDTLARLEQRVVPITFRLQQTDSTNGFLNFAEITTAQDTLMNVMDSLDVDSNYDNDPTDDTGDGPDSPDNDRLDGRGPYNPTPDDEDDHDGERLNVFDVALAKRSGTLQTIQVLDTLSAFITVYNQSPYDTITNVDIIDYLPPNTTVIIDTCGWSPQVGTTTTNSVAGPLAPGDSAIVCINFRVEPGALAPLENYAEIFAFDDVNGTAGSDADATNDQTDDNDAGGQTESPADNYVLGDGTGVVGNGVDSTDEDDHDGALYDIFDLALIKTLEDTTPVIPGDTVVFKIKVTNQGNIAAGEIEIADYIAPGYTYLAGINNPAGWTLVGDTAFYTLNVGDTLSFMEMDSVEIALEILPGFPIDSMINVAEIGSAMDSTNTVDLSDADFDSNADVNPGNDSGGQPNTDDDNNTMGNGPAAMQDEDDADPALPPFMDLALTKQLDSVTNLPPFIPGDTVSFLITVYNQGTVPAFNVEVTDYLQSGTSVSGGTNGPVTTMKGLTANVTNNMDSTFTIDQLDTNDVVSFQIEIAISDTVRALFVRNWAEISEADNDNDPSNGTAMDFDSELDSINFNSVGETDDLADDDVIDESGRDGLDEDDHDPAQIPISLISIGSTVWNDLDNNGIQDVGELGIANVAIELLDTMGMVLAYDTTDVNGDYFFGLFYPGDYQVRISSDNFLPGGPLELFTASSQPTDPNDNQEDGDDNGIQSGGLGAEIVSPLINLSDLMEPVGAEENFQGGLQDDAILRDSSGDMTVDFGLFQPVVVGDYAFIDLNNDGVQNAGDVPLEGVTVTLYDANADTIVMADAAGNPISGMTTTDLNGFYLFDDLPPGEYYVQFDITTAMNYQTYAFTEPNVSGNTQDGVDSDADTTFTSSFYVGETETTGTMLSGDTVLTLDAGVICIARVDAGNNLTACITNPVNLQLLGASAFPVPPGTATWSTSGTGTFDVSGTDTGTFGVDTQYIPSQQDIQNRTITLTLTLDTGTPCGIISDSVIITLLNVDCGSFPQRGN